MIFGQLKSCWATKITRGEKEKCEADCESWLGGTSQGGAAGEEAQRERCWGELGVRFDKIRPILGWLKGQLVRERRQPVGHALGKKNKPKCV